MRRTALLFSFLLFIIQSWSQNPATIFSIPSRNIVLPCGTTCTSLSAVVPHIKQTNNYIITTMPYLPFAYRTTTGNELTSVYQDDTWSDKISIGSVSYTHLTLPTSDL